MNAVGDECREFHLNLPTLLGLDYESTVIHGPAWPAHGAGTGEKQNCLLKLADPDST